MGSCGGGGSRVDRGVPSPAPLRSGRARLTHPAPQVRGSPRRSTRRHRYPREFRGDALGVRCPRRRSLSRFPDPMPPSLHGVPSGGFPRFIGTTRHSDSLSSVPRRFVAFALRYYVAPEVLGADAGGRVRDDWGWSPVPDPVNGHRDDRASQVPGEPPAHMRCSLTPVGPSYPATTARWRGLPLFPQRRLPRFGSFRGSIAPPMCSLCTLRRPRHRGPRNTRFRLLASSAGRGWIPAGLQYEVFELLHLGLLIQA